MFIRVLRNLWLSWWRDYRLVNVSTQTQLNTSGAEVDAVRKVLEDNLIRVTYCTYCTVFGRKEQSQVRKLVPLEPANRELESLIDV